VFYGNIDVANCILQSYIFGPAKMCTPTSLQLLVTRKIFFQIVYLNSAVSLVLYWKLSGWYRPACIVGKLDRVADLLWCVRSAVGAESGPMWDMWRPLASRGTAAPRGRGTIRERRYRPPLYVRAGKHMKRSSAQNSSNHKT